MEDDVFPGHQPSLLLLPCRCLHGSYASPFSRVLLPFSRKALSMEYVHFSYEGKFCCSEDEGRIWFHLHRGNSELNFTSISFILCAILCVLCSNQKTVDSPMLEIDFMCLNLLIQGSSVVLKLTLGQPHLMHIDLAIEQLLCICTNFYLCAIHPEAFLQGLSHVL